MKKLLAAVFSATLIMGLATAVSADNGTTNTGGALVSGDGTNVQAAIIKELDTGIGTPLTSDVFTFSFEPKQTVSSVTAKLENGTTVTMPAPEDVQTSGHPAIADIKITYDPAGTAQAPAANVRDTVYTAATQKETDTTNRMDRYRFSTGNFLHGVDITSVSTGIYVYEVKEKSWVHTALASANGTEETVQSQAIYDIYLYIDENDNGDNYIKAIGVVMKKTNGTPGSEYWEPAVDDKVDPTLIIIDPTPGTTDLFDGDFVFFNSYTRKPKDNPEDPQRFYLKKVMKAGQTSTDTFYFSVELSKPASAADTIFYGQVLDANGNNVTAMQNSTNFVAAHTATQADVDAGLAANVGDQVAAYIPFTLDSSNKVVATVGLKADQKLCFDKLPVGTYFRTEETSNSSNSTYKMTTVRTVNGTATNPPLEGGASQLSTDTANYMVTTGEDNVVTTNAADTPITGIITNNLPFFIMVVLAVVAMVAYAIVRGMRKRA